MKVQNHSNLLKKLAGLVGVASVLMGFPVGAQQQGGALNPTPVSLTSLPITVVLLNRTPKPVLLRLLNPPPKLVPPCHLLENRQQKLLATPWWL